MSNAFPAAGTEHAGFIVQEQTSIPELNLDCLLMTHRRTGARLLHLANDDPNNLFAVAFRTPPTDSTGVAHILEHTVLCGSERYPVRDPFFAMLKRSLNTFMNALTSSDWTCYPFSSQNRKDFDNLLGIYLDAVFFPLLREQDFHQEGHRLEFVDNDPENPLTLQGVVYNEMKGAMASPASLLGRRLGRALYPTSTYRHNSGGEPSDIPALTWEGLKQFHASHYHPSNSWFFTYGSFPVEAHLETIDKLALSRFTAIKTDTAVLSEQRLDRPWQVTETFPLAPDEDPAGKTMIQVAWLTNDIEQIDDRLALTQLSSLLLGNPAAPLYRALLESGLGSNLAPGIGYHDENRTTCFAAGLQGSEPEHAQAIENLVLEQLEKIAREGFSPERIEGVLHRFEFINREVGGDHYPYPLTLFMRLLGPWLHADEPLTSLRLTDNLRRLRSNLLDRNYVEQLIRRNLIDNPHRVLLILRPDQSRQRREEEALAGELEEKRESLSVAARQQLVRQALELRRAQESEPDLSCLPTLSRSDIPTQEPAVDRVETLLGSTRSLRFPQPTNGIAYLSLAFPLDQMAQNETGLLPVMSVLLSQIGAAGLGYAEMAERMERYTGGVHAGIELLEETSCLDRWESYLLVKGKSLYRYQKQLLEIITDILAAPDFTNLERIRTVIGQLRTSMENSIPGAGHSYAARAAAATLSGAASLREQWSGISQLRFLRKLCGLSLAELSPVAENLSLLAKRSFVLPGLQVGITAETSGIDSLAMHLPSLLAAVPTEMPARVEPSRPDIGPARRRGFSGSLPVAYCAKVFATVPFSHPDAPALLALAKLLRSGYLHREIREKGGAYGGLAGYNPEAGIFSLLSYRDPHIARTLEVFSSAAEWGAGGGFSDQEIDESILATFSDLDRPLSPGGRGSREFLNQLQGLSLEQRQTFRSSLLSTSREDLKRVAERYLVAGEQQSSVAVLANTEMLTKANRELGGKALEVESL